MSYCEGWYLGTLYVAVNKKLISELYDLILRITNSLQMLFIMNSNIKSCGGHIVCRII